MLTVVDGLTLVSNVSYADFLTRSLISDAQRGDDCETAG